MKPNKTIQKLTNQKLLTIFEKEIISHNGEKFDELGNRIRMCSKNRLDMLRTELMNRLNDTHVDILAYDSSDDDCGPTSQIMSPPPKPGFSSLVINSITCIIPGFLKQLYTKNKVINNE